MVVDKFCPRQPANDRKCLLSRDCYSPPSSPAAPPNRWRKRVCWIHAPSREVLHWFWYYDANWSLITEIFLLLHFPASSLSCSFVLKLLWEKRSLMRLIERLAEANKFLPYPFTSAFFPLMVRENLTVLDVTFVYTDKKHDLGSFKFFVFSLCSVQTFFLSHNFKHMIFFAMFSLFIALWKMLLEATSSKFHLNYRGNSDHASILGMGELSFFLNYSRLSC